MNKNTLHIICKAHHFLCLPITVLTSWDHGEDYRRCCACCVLNSLLTVSGHHDGLSSPPYTTPLLAFKDPAAMGLSFALPMLHRPSNVGNILPPFSQPSFTYIISTHLKNSTETSLLQASVFWHCRIGQVPSYVFL